MLDFASLNENTYVVVCTLQDFHEEYAVEAFRRFDKEGSGFISALDFQDIMISIKSHLLTKEVRANLVAVSSDINTKLSINNV